jgi:hypothetical protein
MLIQMGGSNLDIYKLRSETEMFMFLCVWNEGSILNYLTDWLND